MFNHPWNKPLDIIITFSFAALLFFVPLFFYPTSSELFEFNKMILTYILTGFITTFWLIKIIINKQLILRKSFLNLTILLFLLGQLITTFFSINPHTSIWGYYSRFHGGLASTISYSLLFYIALNHFSQDSQKPKLKLLLYSALSTSTLISLYGILEHFGIDKDRWVQDVQNRVFSTLGQPNWLSAYLVAILPFPLLIALNSKEKKISLLLGLVAFANFITILYTKSRSGIGTTFIILFLIILYQLTKLKKATHTRSRFLGLLLLLVTSLAIIGSPWSPNPQNIQDSLKVGGPLWPQLEPYLNRVNLTTQLKPLDISALPEENQKQLIAQADGRPYGGSNSWDIRQVVWQGAVDLFKSHPLTGTGPETFAYAYYWTRPAAHNLLSEWDFLYNKAHNEYLNFLATTGLIGISTYLILILSTLILLIRLYRQYPAHQTITISFILSYLSILITNYFGFSVVTVATFFFLTPALALAYTSSQFNTFSFGPGWSFSKKDLKKLKNNVTTPSLSMLQYIAITLLALIFVFWFSLILKHWLADRHYAKGKALSQNGYLSQAIPSLESAVKLYPNEPTFRSILAETYANAALATKQQYDSLDQEQAKLLEKAALAQQQNYTKLALDNINQTLDQNPYHLNFIKSKAKVYLSLAQIDPQYYQLTLDTLLRATQLAPTDPKLLYNIGLLYIQLDNLPQAKIALRQAIDLKPNYDHAIAELIKLYQQEDNQDQIQKLKDQLLFYYPDHPFAATLE